MSLDAYPSLLHALLMPQQGDMTLSLIAHAPHATYVIEMQPDVGGGGGVRANVLNWEKII
jgi:hypothetical protein